MANGKTGVKFKGKMQQIGNSFYILVPVEYIKVYELDTTETKDYEVTIKEPNGTTEVLQ